MLEFDTIKYALIRGENTDINWGVNKATQPEWRSLCSARITTQSSTNTTVGFTERCSVVQEKDIVLPIGIHSGYGFAAKWCRCYANTQF